MEPQEAWKCVRSSFSTAFSPYMSWACSRERQHLPARRPEPWGKPVIRAQYPLQKSQNPARASLPMAGGSALASSRTVTSPVPIRSQRSTSLPRTSSMSVSTATSSPSSPPPESRATRLLRAPPIGGSKLSVACLTKIGWSPAPSTDKSPQLLPWPATSPGFRMLTSTYTPLGATIRIGPSPRPYFSTTALGGCCRLVSRQTPQNCSALAALRPSPRSGGGGVMRAGGPTACPALMSV
mmetsp:Transcript_152942/g.281892  ORF Transcript_152942/g.281892 Transcript_152942/m.281892 type:complete len:238 (+) Transcript_152942:268-981(+)